MKLFEPYSLRSVHLRNRIVVSPMCEYSAVEGVPQDWHLVHLGSRAVGGAGLVIAEATAVEAIGRISPEDTGLWNKTQADAWARITSFIADHGAVAGIQLAHAGRKASTAAPWVEERTVGPDQGGWIPVAPSALAYSARYPEPVALDSDGINAVVEAFRLATIRAVDSGFRLIEIHAAHGYLLHEFLSPLSNLRTDEWGGSFENRIRLTRSIVAAVRSAMPESLPLLVRISATDWVQGGWDIEQSIELSRLLKTGGVDLVDVSSGGLSEDQVIDAVPGYQVPFAARIRKEAGIATSAVGLITEARQAESILASGQADLVQLARELLRDPYWPRRAAAELGVTIEPPKQYARAW
ncbi:NADH:flavin oxidoreductase/NADH oxidase [Dokdonella sp.]|uniref:NADH:flavin oxidoreductase/NADH oxidase n=1 Tax=Dokdonella sp. TaxID=2291710 RepID=UPI003C60E520